MRCVNLQGTPEIIYVFDYVTKSKKVRRYYIIIIWNLNFYLCCFLLGILCLMFDNHSFKIFVIP